MKFKTHSAQASSGQLFLKKKKRATEKGKNIFIFASAVVLLNSSAFFFLFPFPFLHNVTNMEELDERQDAQQGSPERTQQLHKTDVDGRAI